MSNTLVDFLTLPNVDEIVKDVFISDRLGTFKIRPMTQKNYSSYRKRCVGKLNKNGTSFDSDKFAMLCVINHVIEPDFNNITILDKLDCASAEDLINKKLLPGEIIDIGTKISDLSGFEEDINDKIEEAKN